MSIFEKLLTVQQKLKAPKKQHNAFGNYNYRSCEDITEAVKPLLAEVKAVLLLTDEIVIVSDRVYVKAMARLIDAESDGVVEVCGWAREAESRPKFDVAQLTGAASSYARKYALNGLLALDDTKDADADGVNNAYKPNENRRQGQTGVPKQKNAPAGKAEPQSTGDKFVRITPQGDVMVMVSAGVDASGQKRGLLKSIRDIPLAELEQMLGYKQYTLAHAAIKNLLAETEQSA